MFTHFLHVLPHSSQSSTSSSIEIRPFHFFFCFFSSFPFPPCNFSFFPSLLAPSATYKNTSQKPAKQKNVRMPHEEVSQLYPNPYHLISFFFYFFFEKNENRLLPQKRKLFPEASLPFHFSPILLPPSSHLSLATRVQEARKVRRRT